MIRPPGFRGAAFGGAAEGDGRLDPTLRAALRASDGIPLEWAFATQVHGRSIVTAAEPGRHGEADALVTETPGLALTVATADCVPIVIEGDGVVAVVHAGWRGARAGIVDATLRAIGKTGHVAARAAIGPAIGPCCYEVGDEVAAEFPHHLSVTDWGTQSVDLVSFVRDRLGGLEVWSDGRCTRHDRSLLSFRRDRTKERQVSLGWIPPD
jgi:purine-nucleoside/S-methyl-5'-thioadenosine phosphorylase / adenosine deaminase